MNVIRLFFLRAIQLPGAILSFKRSDKTEDIEI